MTKQNPDRLCSRCKEFDERFERGLVRLDYSVHCDHDEEIKLINDIDSKQKTTSEN